MYIIAKNEVYTLVSVEEQSWYANVSRGTAESRLKHCNKVQYVHQCTAIHLDNYVYLPHFLGICTFYRMCCLI